MNQTKHGTALGMSLIFVVFIVLSLLVFGTLSFLLAKNECALSLSAQQSVQAFYDADMQAAQTLQQVDELLCKTLPSAQSAQEYATLLQQKFADQSHIVVTVQQQQVYCSFFTPVSPQEYLHSIICVQGVGEQGTSAQDELSRYTVKKWSLVTGELP